MLAWATPLGFLQRATPVVSSGFYLNDISIINDLKCILFFIRGFRSFKIFRMSRRIIVDIPCADHTPTNSGSQWVL